MQLNASVGRGDMLNVFSLELKEDFANTKKKKHTKSAIHLKVWKLWPPYFARYFIELR